MWENVTKRTYRYKEFYKTSHIPVLTERWAGPKKRTQCEVRSKAVVNNVLGDNYVQMRFLSFFLLKGRSREAIKTDYALVTCLPLLLQNITTHTIDLTWTQWRSCHLAEMQRSIQFPFQPHGAPISYDRRKSQNTSTYHIHKQITSKLTRIQRNKICEQWVCYSKKA